MWPAMSVLSQHIVRMPIRRRYLFWNNTQCRRHIRFTLILYKSYTQVIKEYVKAADYLQEHLYNLQ